MLVSTFALTVTLALHATAQTWKNYPLQLEGNPGLTFPGIEGIQYHSMGDSWFFTGLVEGETTSRKLQVVTIFDRNYITAAILNFYQVSIFDYGTGDFNTFTQYDLPGIDLADMKFHASPGSLDVGFNSSAGDAYWRSARTSQGDLIPFEYKLNCPGKDHVSGSPFSFDLALDMQKKPVAFGASELKGNLTFYAQKNTLTYWQPGPLITGVVNFNGITEKVKGSSGHVDRQVFPLYSGIFTPTGRQHSHEWRQINLDNGIDLAIWRQFDRIVNNSVIETSGVTTSYPPRKPRSGASPPTYQHALPDDLTVEYISYSKYPRGSYSTLIPPPSPNMYLPSAHIIRSKKLKMDLHAEYVAPAPVAQLPIEYFEGPARWTGTYDGQNVTGVGIFESTLALYRDWELADALYNSVAHLPSGSFANPASQNKIITIVRKLAAMVSSNPAKDHRGKARQYTKTTVLPGLMKIRNMSDKEHMLEMANDFVASLSIVL